jgi:hypothetical protein
MIEALLESKRRIANKEGLLTELYATRSKEGLSHVAQSHPIRLDQRDSKEL